MILLEPNVINQQVSVFVRDVPTSGVLTDESTKQETTFVPLPIMEEGVATFSLEATPEKDKFYTLILRDGSGAIANYSLCFCGDNLQQQFSRIGSKFTQPVKDKPSYNVPVK